MYEIRTADRITQLKEQAEIARIIGNLDFNDEKLNEVLKPGGLIIIGLYHKYGRINQKIRQNLIKIFGDS